MTPVRNELRASHPLLLVLNNDPLTALMRLSISQDLLVATVASLFGVVTLALAALGLYGVMTYATTRRTSEFGLRMALGAESRAVGRMVLGEAMRLVIGGAVVGLPLALAATRLLDFGQLAVRLLDQLDPFLEAAARAIEHRFDIDQAARQVGFFHRRDRFLL